MMVSRTNAQLDFFRHLSFDVAMGKAIATTFVVHGLFAATVTGSACARGPLPDPAYSRIEKDSSST